MQTAREWMSFVCRVSEVDAFFAAYDNVGRQPTRFPAVYMAATGPGTYLPHLALYSMGKVTYIYIWYRYFGYFTTYALI